MPASFPDYFSSHAAAYAANRPGYPDALFEFLASVSPSRRLAWDCACGNGQATLPLADRFERVVATDASADQLRHAPARENIEYRAAVAEAPALEEGAVDLACAAQALHWLDLELFYPCVRQALKPRGVFAAWGYALTRVSAGVDAIVDDLYAERLRGWWPDARRHIETAYADLPFPFEPIETPDLRMEASWTLERFLAYLRTWSAVKRLREASGRDAVGEVEPALRGVWGEGERRVEWPLFIRAGRKA